MLTLVGKIVCKRINLGSKSECDGFFILADNDDRKTSITLEDENPFEQLTLKSFVGKWVVAKGTFHRETFVAKSVKLY